MSEPPSRPKSFQSKLRFFEEKGMIERKEYMATTSPTKVVGEMSGEEKVALWMPKGNSPASSGGGNNSNKVWKI